MNRLTPSPEFDPRISDWLESDPDDAPPEVLDTVLAAFPSIPQRRARRVPWRFSAMNRFAQLGVAAAIVVLVVGAAALLMKPGGNVGATPSRLPSTVAPSPSALAAGNLEKDFVSDRYGYAVSYFPPWTVVPATKTWLPGLENRWNTGYNDELRGSDIRFSGASQRLGASQTEGAWLAAYAGGADPATWPTIQVGGATGRLDADGVPAAGGTIMPGGRMFDVVAIKDGVASNFNMDGNVDRATFDAVLSSIRLTPSTSTTPVALSAEDAGPTLRAGTYHVADFAAPFSITFPAGWVVGELGRNNIGFALGGDGRLSINLAVIDKVYPDPCHPASPRAVGAGVDGLISSLSSMKGFKVINMADVTIGGASGKAFTLINTITADAGCAGAQLPFATYQKGSAATDLQMFPEERDLTWALEAGGTTVVIFVNDSAVSVQASQPVLSLSFDPASSS